MASYDKRKKSVYVHKLFVVGPCKLAKLLVFSFSFIAVNDVNDV